MTYDWLNQSQVALQIRYTLRFHIKLHQHILAFPLLLNGIGQSAQPPGLDSCDLAAVALGQTRDPLRNSSQVILF